jgi:glyoxylase-like metal-dependent hydrolase (beta-lactamase superfamily II)
MLERIDEATVRLEYPIPVQPGPPPVNLYLLEGSRPVLIDAGSRDDDVAAALGADLASLGLGFGDVAALIVTHHHSDHSGLARSFDEAGVPVFLHEDDHIRVSLSPEERADELTALRRTVRFWGAPDEYVEAVPRTMARYDPYRSDLPRSRWRKLPVGEVLEWGDRRLEAIHCPGHAAGLCALWEAERGYLYSSDHLLGRITSNPSLYHPFYRGRETGLADYLHSLERIRDNPARLVLPGHGRPFEGVARRVDEILAEYRERRAQILSDLARGPLTILDLVGKIWADRPLDPSQIYLACREVHGHLDILEDENLVLREKPGGVGRFRVVQRTNPLQGEMV